MDCQIGRFVSVHVEEAIHMNNRVALAALFLASAILQAACSSRDTTPGARRVAERSGRERGWVSDETPIFLDDGYWYFRGQALGVADLTLGLRRAEADAKKRILPWIAERAVAEYSELTLGAGTDTIGADVLLADDIGWVTETISLTGVGPARVYWERIETGLGYGVRNSYDVRVLVSIPVVDFESARARAVRRIEQRERAAAIERLEKSSQRLQQQLREEPQEEWR